MNDGSAIVNGQKIYDVNLINDETLGLADEKFRPRVESQIADVTINATDTNLFTFNGGGIIQAIQANFNRDDAEFAIKVDTVEIFRIVLSQLSDAQEHNLNDITQHGEFPIRNGSNTSSIIIDFGSIPAGFGSSFELIARRTGGSTTTMKALMCIYRELV